MKGKVSKSAVDALIADAKAADAAFFCGTQSSRLRRERQGGRLFLRVQYRLGGRGAPTKRLTLGKHGPLTPDEARRWAQVELGKVADVKDVAQAKKDERAKLKAGHSATCRKRVSQSKANGQRQASGSPGDGRKSTPCWRSRLSGARKKVPDAVTKAELAGLINKTKANSHSVARRLHETLRPLFKWAFGRGEIQSNPWRPSSPEPETPRDRVLTDDEIKALWQAATAENWPFSAIFKILLLTGQRKNEVAGMRWREVDLDAGDGPSPKSAARTARRTQSICTRKPLGCLIPLAMQRRRDGPMTRNMCSAPQATAPLRLVQGQGPHRCQDAGNPWRRVPALAHS